MVRIFTNLKAIENTNFSVIFCSLSFLAAIEELQANLLEMPFLGDDVSFFALLPEGVNGLDETINRLSLDNLRDAMSRTFPVTVEVGLPKFRIEQNTDLRNVLHNSLESLSIVS